MKDAQDEYATDAHFASEATYDFYKTNFNRNSLDDNGLTLAAYVHYDVDLDNAFWDGGAMYYGGMFGPLLCGYLGEVYGWHYGFGLAGVGMLIGLIVFKLGLPRLTATETESRKLQSKNISIPLTSIEKSRILVILILSVFTMFFWFAFEQAGSSMNLFADRYMERNLFGYEIPASMFQSLNALLILLLAPLFARLWTELIQRGKEPNTTLKFSLAFVLLGIGFIFLA